MDTSSTHIHDRYFTGLVQAHIIYYRIKHCLSMYKLRQLTHKRNKSEGLYVKFVSELPEFMHT